MSELKTKRNRASVQAFLRGIEDATRRQDCRTLVTLMKQATGEKPEMWGTSIVGFGSYHYKGASGREGDWFLAGFSPRKQNLTLYIMAGFDEYDELLDKLGKYSTGKACLYIKRLEDVDQSTLKKLIRQSSKHMLKSNASA